MITGSIPFIVLAFSIKDVLIAGVAVGALGLLLGVALGIAGKVFFVKVDEREGEVRECLPGNNCGGCGYPGCDGLAAAIAAGNAPANACPVANAEAHSKIAEIMGSEVEASEKKVAFVKCSGTCDQTERKYNYYGIADCKKLVHIPGQGDKLCEYGCLGFGSCVTACKFDAIHVIDGVAVVDKEKCVACGKCVAECPKHLIELVPYSSTTFVGCSSKDKGKDVKAACKTGCIGCMICTKQCETGAITVENNLAHIDYSKCTNCGKCAEKCPQHIIKISKSA